MIPIATVTPSIPEEIATSGDDHFVQQLSCLNIEVSLTDIQSWMNSDGPGYQHMDKQGIVDLIMNNEEEDEEEDE